MVAADQVADGNQVLEMGKTMSTHPSRLAREGQRFAGAGRQARAAAVKETLRLGLDGQGETFWRPAGALPSPAVTFLVDEHRSAYYTPSTSIPCLASQFLRRSKSGMARSRRRQNAGV